MNVPVDSLVQQMIVFSEPRSQLISMHTLQQSLLAALHQAVRAGCSRRRS